MWAFRPNWELRNYRDQMWIDQIGFGQIVQHATKQYQKKVPEIKVEKIPNGTLKMAFTSP